MCHHQTSTGAAACFECNQSRARCPFVGRASVPRPGNKKRLRSPSPVPSAGKSRKSKKARTAAGMAAGEFGVLGDALAAEIRARFAGLLREVREGFVEVREVLRAPRKRVRIAVPDEEDEAFGEVATSPAGVAGVEGAEQEGELDDRASQLMQGLGISTPRPAPEGEEASAGGSLKVADPPAEGTDIAMEGAS